MIPSHEFYRIAIESGHGPDKAGAAALLASAVARAKERQEGAIDLDIVERALFLLLAGSRQ